MLAPDISGVYVADTFTRRYPLIYQHLSRTVAATGTPVRVLPGTRDIWARDYMPVPTPAGELIRFRYAPDYLRGPRWQHLITDAASVCQQLGIKTQQSEIVLDGGNVVRGPGKVVLTEKVLAENPDFSPARLRQELRQLLETNQLVLLPADPQDFTGHADGMLHFLDEHTVLLNNYSQEKSGFWPRLRAALRKARLDWVFLPYNPYRNSSIVDAAGIYSNFLCIGQQLLAPVFGQREDEDALRQLARVFPSHSIQPIECRALAREGGLLHCVTWTPRL